MTWRLSARHIAQRLLHGERALIGNAVGGDHRLRFQHAHRRPAAAAASGVACPRWAARRLAVDTACRLGAGRARVATGREGWSTTTGGSSREDDCACAGVASIIAANTGNAAPSHPALFKHAFIYDPHDFARRSVTSTMIAMKVRGGYNDASIAHLELVLM